MGEPELWQGIFIQNKEQLAFGIDGLIEELLKFKSLLENEHQEALKSTLKDTQITRLGLATNTERAQAIALVNAANICELNSEQE